MTRVLISGGGIAGSALAYWLDRNGFAVTVVERAPAARTGGQAVDVRGAALTVVERMGLLEEARAARTRMRGMSLLDADGHEVHRSTEETYSAGRLDSDDVELLREDLVRILHRPVADRVEFRYGDSVTGLTEDGHGVRVDFERGDSHDFDLVVGADGLHSRVRRLAFGPEERFLRQLGTRLAIFSADNFLGLEDWQVWQRDGACGYAVYPVRGNSELRITFGYGVGPGEDFDHRDTEGTRKDVAERMGALRWETPRMLAALERATDLYADTMAQVHMDSWSTGRTVLLGDAGYCASPLSGQGTSLALVGAYLLADELGRADGDHRAALERYEARMRPFVALNQALATENPEGPASPESVERAKNAVALDR